MQAAEDGYGLNRKNLKKAKKPPVLDEGLLKWLREVRSQKMPVSGDLFQAKAQEIAAELRLTDFKASNSWLEKFKRRHFIKFMTMHEGAFKHVEKVVEKCFDFSMTFCNFFNMLERTLMNQRELTKPFEHVEDQRFETFFE